MRFLILAFWTLAPLLQAQELPSFQVADQTFRVSGADVYHFAFAEGDQLDLHVQLIAGRELKSVELVRFPDFMVFRSYELDTVLDKSIRIPQTGVYSLRFQETGLSKKICRFTLQRTPETEEMARFDTRIGWDLEQYPQFQLRSRRTDAGKKTEVVPVNGQITISASKFGLKNPVNSYQFELPPNTVQWAYRISVGQESIKARRQDADKLSLMLKTTSAKALTYQPETALAAFALGMAIDMTVSTAGEDVEYALLDAENLPKFVREEADYQAPIWQGGVSVDVQRRYAPLEGVWYFAFRSNNWVADINVYIDIEAVTETRLYGREYYLEPVRP